MTYRLGRLGAAIFVIATVLVSSATAQTTTSPPDRGDPRVDPPPTVPVSPADGALQLGDIVVTAQRRSESLQRVPVAVTAVSGETLAAQQITKPSQLVFVAPSLQQQSSVGEVGATNFSVRGIGTTVFGPGIESSVATVLDDVTLSRPQLGIIQFFDVDNVQILRGPQGMLFGKNASAGVVSINTHRPQLGENSADVYASSGIHDSIGNQLVANGNATLNLAVGETAAVRASVFGVRNEPVINARGTGPSDFGLTEYGGRLKVLWQPSHALDVYVLGDYVREHGVGDGAYTSRINARGGVLEALQAAGGVTASPKNLDDASNGRNFQRFESGGAQMNLRYTFDSGASLTNIVAYRAYADRGSGDYDSSPFSLGDQLGRSRDLHQWSEELRFASPAGERLTYQVGLYALDLQFQTNFDQRFNLQPLLPAPPAGFANLGATRDEHISSQSYAAFGQAEFKIIDGLGIIAGGRFTHDRTAGRNIFDTSQFLIPLIPPGTTRNRVENDNFSWRAGLNWQATPNLLAYVTYARGYKGPALDETSLAVVRPEIPSSVEGGIKATLLDRRLTINLAGFHSVYKNFQAQAFQTIGASGNFTTLNAGSLRVQGAEIDVRAVPFRGFTINGGASYIDGIYKSFAGAPCYPNQPTGTAGRNVCFPNQSTDVSGGRLANAPRFTFTIGGQYEHSLDATTKGVIGADLYHRSALNYSPTPDPRTVVGGLNLVGVRAGIGAQDGTWMFEVFGRNIFDKRFPTYVTPNPFGGTIGDNALGGDYYQTFGSESFRTIGVSFTGHF